MSTNTCHIDMREFNRSIGKIMGLVETGIRDEVLKKVAFDTLRNLQKTTPRKTGRARAGWNTTVNAPPSEWKPPKGSKRYSLQPFKGADGITYHSVINFSNNVEYIIPLDEGTSVQAPAGILEPVLSRMTAYLNRVAAAQSRMVIK